MSLVFTCEALRHDYNSRVRYMGFLLIVPALRTGTLSVNRGCSRVIL